MDMTCTFLGIIFWNGVYRFENTTPADMPFEMIIDINDFFKKTEIICRNFSCE